MSEFNCIGESWALLKMSHWTSAWRVTEKFGPEDWNFEVPEDRVDEFIDLATELNVTTNLL